MLCLYEIVHATEFLTCTFSFIKVEKVDTQSTPSTYETPDSNLAAEGISQDNIAILPETPRRTLNVSRVPSSRIGRLFHYGGLAASLSAGAAAELFKRSSNFSSTETDVNSSLMLTPANVKRLVSKLTQMRGAALKLGQFLSIQGTDSSKPTSLLILS